MCTGRHAHTPQHGRQTSKVCTAAMTGQRELGLISGLPSNLECCMVGFKFKCFVLDPTQKGKNCLCHLYLQFQDTHHNQEAVVVLLGCWSSVFCIELNIPDLGHKTERVCKTQLSGEPVSRLPERHSSFHPVSILDVYQIFLEVNSYYSSYLACQ